MITREPTLERLAIAQSLMLDPFGLSEATLARALATIAEHRVDDADLYFQTTRHEGWSLEEGIVKSGSFSIDQGVGVRAVAGEKTAFAYSDDLGEEALMDAARTVRAIAAAGQNKRVKLARKPRIAASRVLYAPTDPIATLDSAQKVALLERVEKLARAKDPRIAQVMASVGAEYDVVLDGTTGFLVPPGEPSATLLMRSRTPSTPRTRVASSSWTSKISVRVPATRPENSSSSSLR